MLNRWVKLAAATGLVAAAVPSVTGSAAARTALAGSRASWVDSARAVSTVNTSDTISGSVVLRLRDAAGAAQLAQAVSDPASAQYRHYLTPAAWDAAFAPTQASVDRVTAFLRGAGLSVTEVPSNRLYVGFSGSAGRVEAAFGTRLDEFVRNGRMHRAPASTPSVPSNVASDVNGVVGLDDSSATPDLIGPSDQPGYGAPAGFRNAPPCTFTYGSQPATFAPKAYGHTQPVIVCGYTPQQLRGAYGADALLNRGIDGSGQTVAIVDAFALRTLASDVRTWSRNHDVPVMTSGQLTQRYPKGIFKVPSNDPCQPASWGGEEALDVEAVHGMAPGANVFYEGAKSCQDNDLLAAVNDVVANHRAQIVSDSWGDLGEDVPKSEDEAYTDVFQQAAGEGIGVFFSSGDYGDEQPVIGKAETDFPANNPWVTAVGGTSLMVGNGYSYMGETGWGTEKTYDQNNAWNPAPPGFWVYGSGGGTSRVFDEPWYQRGVVPSKLVHRWSSDGGRVVPDIAAVADPNTGYQIGLTQAWPNGQSYYSQYRIGGTSLASPVMAGFEALADQVAGSPHGFANPAIYRLYRNGQGLRDVTSPNHEVAEVRTDFANGIDKHDGYVVSLRTTNHDTSLVTTRGYDDVTGVGTPIVSEYAQKLGS